MTKSARDGTAEPARAQDRGCPDAPTPRAGATECPAAAGGGPDMELMLVACARDPWNPSFRAGDHSGRGTHTPVLACSAAWCSHGLCHAFYIQLSRGACFPGSGSHSGTVAGPPVCSWVGRVGELLWAAGVEVRGWSHGMGPLPCGSDAPSLGEGSRTELNCGAAWSPRTQTQCPTPPRDTSRLRLPVQAGVLTRPPTPAKPVKAPAHSPRGAASSTVPHAASALLSPDR